MNNEDKINTKEELSDRQGTMKEEAKNNEEKDLKASEAVESEASASADDEGPTLKEVIAKQATEDESPFASHFTLKKILGGDVLTTQTIRHQIGVFLLITAFLIVSRTTLSRLISCKMNCRMPSIRRFRAAVS